MHHLGVDGELLATQAGVSLTADQAGQAIELLVEARRRLIEQGWRDHLLQENTVRKLVDSYASRGTKTYTYANYNAFTYT